NYLIEHIVAYPFHPCTPPDSQPSFFEAGKASVYYLYCFWAWFDTEVGDRLSEPAQLQIRRIPGSLRLSKQRENLQQLSFAAALITGKAGSAFTVAFERAVV